MTNRNGTALIYDEENQLKQYGSITFGYAAGGARLWKNNGGTLTITWNLTSLDRRYL